MTSYMALTFTAFVYIPFGNILQPFLNFWSLAAQTISMSEAPLETRQFVANPQRIANQMYYTTVTAQIINTLTEVVVPYIKHKASVKAKELSSKDAVKNNDQPEEAEFLKRVRNQTGLEVYDVTADYREMVMQYGESINRWRSDCVGSDSHQATSPSSPSLGLLQPAFSSSTTGSSYDPTH